MSVGNGSSIAIVGMGCIYPGARTAAELWENVLAQRRAFRRLPSERLRLEDYWSADATAPDRTYASEAAVIEGYEFDRVGFRVAGSTFRAADLAHWLALDVASKALADAGFSEGRGMPRETTGVLLGNTLTGEFSRASSLRLRWPYVRRVVASALARENWPGEARLAWLERLETDFKRPFPPVGEDSLAGGLSNTIAGRICNHFDLRGGGYTVDGACASSLLAVANACAALNIGDLDLALAGGVDLSLDPFEIVGFAKTGALARDEMRVFDRRSEGFWPGEGCGFVVLMRPADALAQGCRVYALIRGWGISSDGSGGITRPEAAGQLEAVRRAYRRASFGIDTVGFCEGHGTGTAVGDATELAVLAQARQEARAGAPAAAVGSIKANIGHTKAAAGVAGLIKAAMAIHTQVVPPTTGCEQPRPELIGPGAALRVLREPELWPNDCPLRASVSAMGFGGINAHLVIESPASERRRSLSVHERSLARSSQGAELFLLAAPAADGLKRQIEHLLELAARISRSELTDLAAQLQKTLEPGFVRAGLVASRPAELAARLQILLEWVKGPNLTRFQASDGLFLGTGQTQPRVVFLFPGQGSPMHLDGGSWRRRFECVRTLYEQADLPPENDSVSTRVMQPAIVTASLAGLRVLQGFGLRADAALGHSLGELVAVHWAEALSQEALLRIARVRGAAMAELGAPTGAMLALGAPSSQVRILLPAKTVEIAGFNSPRQTVVAGEAADIQRLAERAAAAGLRTTRLPVSHAFHTPLVAAAVSALAEQLAREDFAPLRHSIFSTVTGSRLDPHEDLRALFCRQVTSPVRFAEALAALLYPMQKTAYTAPESKPGPPRPDLLIEVGPGAVLSGLVRDTTQVPVVSLDAGGSSLEGLLEALGAAFALGTPLKHGALFADRFTRPFALDWKPKFFSNPCELAPLTAEWEVRSAECGKPARHDAAEQTASTELSQGMNQVGTPVSAIELVRQLVAERAELPVAAVRDEHRLLSDLHLNSITVSQLVSEAARRLRLPRLVESTEFANASVAEVATALEELKNSGRTTGSHDQERQPPGVGAWVESFALELVETERPLRPTQPRQRSRKASASGSSSELPAGLGWRVMAPQNHPLAGILREKFATASGSGVLLCLPEEPGEDHLDLLLEAARAVRALKDQPRFVLVQHGWGGGAFARTLHLETAGLTTCVVNVPPAQPAAADWVLAEGLSAVGCTEVHYDAQGRRWEPRLKMASLVGPTQIFEDSDPGKRGLAAADEFPIGSDDVLLVTGGGKGIAAECALTLGRATGASVALLGRSDPGEDPELAANLARIAAAGVRCHYVRADVTDAAAVRGAVAEAQAKLGPITALLHGAAMNKPKLIEGLEIEAFRRTMAPKVQGLRNVLAAIPAERLRLLISFGSLIARAGLRGEADYATANEWLTARTEKFQSQHARCRCLALEWSVWSGAGMGQRLGRVESLVQQGIIPIPPDEGVRILLESLRHPPPAVALVITGRFGEPPTLKIHQPELPLHRFLERRRVYYPGIELIVDVDLSGQADLYLADHMLQKQRIFPAVMGLEAMAQAAMALTGSTRPPNFEQVELTRPVAVDDGASTTIRLAALRRGPGLVEVCLRSEETDYSVDHFRALCRFDETARGDTRRLPPLPATSEDLPLDPHEHLYGRVLFHEGRFRRLSHYRHLTARECLAEISPGNGSRWFGPYLPEELVLGDPAARDAALHAIQACIPHLRILPVGLDRLVLRRIGPGPRMVQAKQRERHGNTFIYDLEVRDLTGELLERWEGLRLCAVEPIALPAPWPLPLLLPYLGRRLEELTGNFSFRLVLEQAGQNGATQVGSPGRREPASDHALHQALGKRERIWRQPGGKPVARNGEGISAAHTQDLTLAMAGPARVACDLETVAARSNAVWHDLLGAERCLLAARISRERSETTDAAGTRLWTAIECLKKAGLSAEVPLVLESTTTDGWALLRSGTITIATCVVAVREVRLPIAIAAAFDSQVWTGAKPVSIENTD